MRRIGSAMWTVRELPGVVLHSYPSTSDLRGWRMEFWDMETIDPRSAWVLEKLRGQVFPTRRVLVAAVELAMDMYPGEEA